MTQDPLKGPRLHRPIPQRTPKWKLEIATWPKPDQEDWAERAAIMESLGGLSTFEAEKGAWRALTKIRRERHGP